MNYSLKSIVLCGLSLLLFGCSGVPQNGQGTNIWASGEEYVGEFKDDKRNGQGTYTFDPNSQWAGDKYVGEWKDDNRHGQGTYTYADGRIYEGVWENDKFLYAQKISPQKAPTVIADDGEAIAAASGTGFAVTRSGHIVTNHHVINGCNDVKVHYEGKIIPATVLSKDALNDLAVLKADFKPTVILPLRINPNLVKINRSYTFEELAAVLSVHKNTVASWVKNGLPCLKERRPFLILGSEARAYL
jgi:hypothetical protein